MEVRVLSRAQANRGAGASPKRRHALPSLRHDHIHIRHGSTRVRPGPTPVPYALRSLRHASLALLPAPDRSRRARGDRHVRFATAAEPTARIRALGEVVGYRALLRQSVEARVEVLRRGQGTQLVQAVFGFFRVGRLEPGDRVDEPDRVQEEYGFDEGIERAR